MTTVENLLSISASKSDENKWVRDSLLVPELLEEAAVLLGALHT